MRHALCFQKPLILYTVFRVQNPRLPFSFFPFVSDLLRSSSILPHVYILGSHMLALSRAHLALYHKGRGFQKVDAAIHLEPSGSGGWGLAFTDMSFLRGGSSKKY